MSARNCFDYTDLESQVSFGGSRRKKRRSRRVADTRTGRGGNVEGVTGSNDPSRRQRDAAQEAARAQKAEAARQARLKEAQRKREVAAHIAAQALRDSEITIGADRKGPKLDIKLKPNCQNCHDIDPLVDNQNNGPR